MRLIKHDKEWTKIAAAIRYAQVWRMKWEGIVSRATYEGYFAAFRKYSRFAQFVQIGHGTNVRLGEVSDRVKAMMVRSPGMAPPLVEGNPRLEIRVSQYRGAGGGIANRSLPGERPSRLTGKT